MNRKKKITVSEKQLFIVREALEFYSRFISGQVTDLPEVLRSELAAHRNEKALQSLKEFKAVVFPELLPGQAYGVGAPRNSRELEIHRQVSYEMYRQIYVYETRKLRAEGKDMSWSVYSSPTMRYSNEPLMKVEDVENDGEQ